VRPWIIAHCLARFDCGKDQRKSQGRMERIKNQIQFIFSKLLLKNLFFAGSKKVLT